MANKIDIKHRNRIAINGNGQHLTKIRGAIDPTKKIATLDLGIPPEAYQQAKRTEEDKEQKVNEDIQVNKLSEEEQAQLKSLMAKLNG